MIDNFSLIWVINLYPATFSSDPSLWTGFPYADTHQNVHQEEFDLGLYCLLRPTCKTQLG